MASASAEVAAIHGRVGRRADRRPEPARSEPRAASCAGSVCPARNAPRRCEDQLTRNHWRGIASRPASFAARRDRAARMVVSRMPRATPVENSRCNAAAAHRVAHTSARRRARGFRRMRGPVPVRRDPTPCRPRRSPMSGTFASSSARARRHSAMSSARTPRHREVPNARHAGDVAERGSRAAVRNHLPVRASNSNLQRIPGQRAGSIGEQRPRVVLPDRVASGERQVVRSRHRSPHRGVRGRLVRRCTDRKGRGPTRRRNRRKPRVSRNADCSPRSHHAVHERMRGTAAESTALVDLAFQHATSCPADSAWKPAEQNATVDGNVALRTARRCPASAKRERLQLS